MSLLLTPAPLLHDRRGRFALLAPFLLRWAGHGLFYLLYSFRAFPAIANASIIPRPVDEKRASNVQMAHGPCFNGFAPHALTASCRN